MARQPRFNRLRDYWKGKPPRNRAEADMIMIRAIESDSIGCFTNNCGDPHKDCLKEAMDGALSDSLFPVNIGNDLLDSPYYGGSKFYDGPSTPRGFFDDGFWVR